MRTLGESGWVGLALHGRVGGQSEQRETKEDDAQKRPVLRRVWGHGAEAKPARRQVFERRSGASSFGDCRNLDKSSAGSRRISRLITPPLQFLDFFSLGFSLFFSSSLVCFVSLSLTLFFSILFS